MRSTLIAAAAAALFASPAAAASYRLGTLEVGQPWSRPAVAGTNGVGYLTIANHGKAGDALVAVTSPLAAKVEMHSSSMAGGVMSMARLDRVAVPAGGQVAFAPGGDHLMLIGLKKTLVPGEAIPATLSFLSGARVKVSFAVGTGSGPPAAADAMDMGGMKMEP